MHQVEADNCYTWCPWNSHQRFGKKTGGAGNQRKNWDHIGRSIIKIEYLEESWRPEETQGKIEWKTNKDYYYHYYNINNINNNNSWLVGWLDGWLVEWVLRHINLCRLFNAKSIFIQKHFYSKTFLVKHISIWSYSIYSNSSNSDNSV